MRYKIHDLFFKSILILFVLTAIGLRIEKIRYLIYKTSGYLFCPFREITGIMCPGCGMTHAFIELAKFNIKKSFEYNPFIFLIVMLSILNTSSKKFEEYMVKHQIYKIILLIVILWWTVTRFIPSF